jgi:uncharacterized membrane protein
MSELWATLVHAQQSDAIIWFVWTGVWLAIFVSLFFVRRKLDGWVNDDELYQILVTVSYIIHVIVAFAVIWSSTAGYVRLQNPKYYAMQTALDIIKSSTSK